jgi:hypothetical protein
LWAALKCPIHSTSWLKVGTSVAIRLSVGMTGRLKKFQPDWKVSEREGARRERLNQEEAGNQTGAAPIE